LKKSLLASFVVGILSCVSALKAERVKVIGNLPVESTYSWRVDGSASVSCRGSSCTAYISPAQSGIDTVSGAVLKLLKSDGTVVIAECIAKENVATDMMAAAAGVNHSTTYRSCRMPEPSNTEIDAEFHTASVKITFSNPTLDPSGRLFTETYRIKGFLNPKSSESLISAISFTPEHEDRGVACGALKTRMGVHTKKNEHPTGEVSPSSALVYVIQQDEFTVKVFGYFPTRFAVDGKWIAGNHDDSYFFTDLSPGEHQVCAEWEIEFSHHLLPVSLAKLEVQSGRTYYLRERVVFAGLNGERSIVLEPIEETEGKRLIAQYPFSEQKH
jgi:hypothetical protein